MEYINDEKNELNFNDLRKLNRNVKIIPYPEFEKFNSIQEILKNDNDFCIIYFETQSKTQGHFQCMFRTGKTYHFWDSYGLAPSKAKSYIEKTTLIKLNEFKPYLPVLINKSLENGDNWDYNVMDYQSWNQDVSTCGKHCSIRLKYRNLTEQQYYNFLVNTIQKNNLNSFDEAVVFLCFPIIHK